MKKWIGVDFWTKAHRPRIAHCVRAVERETILPLGIHEIIQLYNQPVSFRRVELDPWVSQKKEDKIILLVRRTRRL